jgi:hypothetical protein
MDDWGAAAFWVAVGWLLMTMYNTWRCLKTKDVDSVACPGKDTNS